MQICNIVFLVLFLLDFCVSLEKPAELPGAIKHNKNVMTAKKDGNICKKLNLDSLFRHKATVDEKLENSVKMVESDKTISYKAKLHRLKAINIFQREMNDSMHSLHNSIDNLKSLLKGDYRSILQLKETSKKRLEQLKSSMLQAEDEYNIIIGAEKEEQNELKKNNKKRGSDTIIKKFVDELIGDIAVAADQLESKLDDDAFEHGIHSKKDKIAIETVIKVGGEEKTHGGENNEGIVMLIDSESNHFVLSKPKDGTTTHVDHVLLKEIMYLVILVFFLVLICNLLRLPTMFACIVTGVILGPSGGGYLKSIVQIETVGEFGVFFILFCVGMEFSPEKLQKVLKESVMGIAGMMCLLLFIGLFWGAVFGILPQQSIFVTLCLSLSSTSVVTKLIGGFTTQKEHVASDDVSEDYMNLLVSMLVVQDVILGIFMAILPILAGHSSEKGHSFANVPGNGAVHLWLHGTFGGPAEEMFFTIFELAFALAGIILMTYVLSKYAAAKFFRGLSLFGSNESFVLGVMTAMFFMLMVTEYIGISMELGCFICGSMIGTMGEQTVKQVSLVVEPLKDFFSSLFFASIGFHVFPTFVLSEIAIFVPITVLLTATKFFIVSSVLHQILPKGSKSKWLVAAGLSQMSEFSFVLGSRARRFGLIGREVYLIILSVTTLSLLISPFMWRSVHSSVMQGGKWTIKSVIQRLILPR